MRKTVFLTSFLMFIFVMVACKRSEDWKGKIREIDGIVYVQNPKDPMFDTPILELVEELRIGEMETSLSSIRRGEKSTALLLMGNMWIPLSLTRSIHMIQSGIVMETSMS